MQSAEQLVLDLSSPDLRENALLELSKKRELFQDLAPLLWNSFGTIAALLQEIVSIYPFLSPPNLTPAQSNRVCNALALLQIISGNNIGNGTRLRVISLGNRVIEAEIISGNNIGARTFIPRLILTPSEKSIAFKFKRRQFPLAICFAMTINKSQGQSLSRVGLYLRKPVFSHGQLYVALSRVKSREGLKLLIIDKDGKVTNKTTNVVYKEVFGNL